ncbi:YihY/virulence factor BrkB family protein [Ancrocorticia populi]|uniref:YihY/virulence factor BrkB family protein n=1 Tax=Ancrocorticia populi TaxID=2175228 RepID=A0A2V1JZT6_9ACTO|nr:YihY/virulence factor BrkB family protein [Ancrocorticia populi]PWF24401.1 hypothetical protein DD236_11925 [Ancrocorticia populi]
MLVTIATALTVVIVCAVAVRRVPLIVGPLPPPASTLTVLIAAALSIVAVSGMNTGAAQTIIAGIATATGGTLLTMITGLIVKAVAKHREIRSPIPTGPSIRKRITARADASPWHVRQTNVLAAVVRTIFRAGDVRVTGLAAEMSYYALISIVPITTALGASLGFLQNIVGAAQIDQIRSSIVNALTTVFSQQVASNILAPLVDGLLTDGRGSIAIGAGIITLYLASRVFRAAVRALDDAYRVTSRHHIVVQYLLGFGFTITGLITVVVIAFLLVVGPLLQIEALVEWLGLTTAFETTWRILQWPLVFLIGASFLTLLYRYGPNVKTTWKHCLPGTVFGILGVVLVSTGFIFYVQEFTPTAIDSAANGGALVAAAGQMLSVILVSVLWLWLASIAVLLGGILNAELHSERAEASDAALSGTPSETLPTVGQ